MTVWPHEPLRPADDDDGGLIERLRISEMDGCIYCHGKLTELTSGVEAPPRPDLHEPGTYPLSHASSVYVCPACGWWRTPPQQWFLYGDLYSYANSGVLKNLDLADVETPLDEIRTYLLVRFERRGELNPRLLEQTVAAVMADFGYATEVVGGSGDGGIDVILRDTDGTVIGVQVKRYKASIEVEQIRSLMGALMLRGLTRGVFVTTSSFRRGVTEAARRSAALGLPIELVDADRFFSALQITARPPYETFEQWKAAVGEFYDLPSGFQHFCWGNPEAAIARRREAEARRRATRDTAVVASK